VGEQSIDAAVAEVVEDAAAEAVAEVHQAAAVEAAADAVEDAAERLEDAAAAHQVAVAQVPDQGDLAQLVRTEGRSAMAELLPAGGAEPITQEHAVEVAEAAAETAVEQIVEAAQDAADDAAGSLDDAELELPGDGQAEGAVEDVADVIDQAASDQAPRSRHWMQRPLIGRRS
jgi:hypothetical protein